MKHTAMAVLTLAIFFCASSAHTEPVVGLGHKPTSLREQLEEKVLLNGVPRTKIEEILNDPRTVVGLIPNAEGKSDLYSEESVRRGLLFMKTYRDVFEYAQAIFGASPYYITARFRAETNFGKYMGRNLIVTALYWLYVLSDAHGQQNAVDRLSTFIRICDENEFDIFNMKGSLAGAFGLPQFMPSLYEQLLHSPDRKSIDWNHDGKIDLSYPPEAILAVAWVDDMNGWGRRAAQEKRAIYLYNHDWSYVRMIMTYAALLKEMSCRNGNIFNDRNCYEHPIHRIYRAHHARHSHHRHRKRKA